MRRADIAMYNAKWQRSGVEHYRDEIDRRTPARLSMLGDLRSAIEGDGLDVVYQPKLDLVTGRIVGAEALVRWEHQSRGVVAPTEFVRVAEDTGLIKELTDLVLAPASPCCGGSTTTDSISGLAVNLSTHDLFDSRLPERVRGYLDDNGVRADALTLEITESSLLIDAPRTRGTIDDLHAVGLRLAIDDFGTGYSSLSYLRRLPVHELKIDQSFVNNMLNDPHDEVIVRSTIDLGPQPRPAGRRRRSRDRPDARATGRVRLRCGPGLRDLLADVRNGSDRMGRQGRCRVATRTRRRRFSDRVGGEPAAVGVIVYRDRRRCQGTWWAPPPSKRLS